MNVRISRLAKLIRQTPLSSYFVLSFLFTWSLLPLAATSIPISLAALCGPAIAAFIVMGIMDHEERRKFYTCVTEWRIPLCWYIIALLLPLPITALRSSLEKALGANGTIEFQSISLLSLVVFILVVGEEVGWRGFALPRLVPRFGRLGASVIIGIVWAFWHLPLFFISSMPQYGSPFLPFIGYTVALSVILTFLAQGTRGSVVIATLFHGAVNTFGLTNSAASSTLRGHSNALCYGLAALIIALVWWRQHTASKQMQTRNRTDN